MKRILYSIERQMVSRLAQEFFIRSSGLSREGDQFEKMREQAFKIKEEMEKMITLRGVVSWFDEFQMRKESLFVQGKEFKCNPFSMISPKAVKGVCLYALTAGEHYQEDRDIMEQLYADMWGNSYVDAGRKIVADHISEAYAEKGKTIVSQSFGPGFYGMDTEDLKKILEITNATEIGLNWVPSGMMVPIKSCAGIYLIVDVGTGLPVNECETCLGSRSSCHLCNGWG